MLLKLPSVRTMGCESRYQAAAPRAIAAHIQHTTSAQRSILLKIRSPLTASRSGGFALTKDRDRSCSAAVVARASEEVTLMDRMARFIKLAPGQLASYKASIRLPTHCIAPACSEVRFVILN